MQAIFLLSPITSPIVGLVGSGNGVGAGMANAGCATEAMEDFHQEAVMCDELMVTLTESKQDRESKQENDG